MSRRAGGLLAAGVAAAVTGRLLGLTELYVLAGAAPAAVALAWLEVRVPPLRLVVGRGVRPRRVPAAGTCEVELRLHNGGKRPTPVLALVDPVGDGRTSRLRLAPVAPGRTQTSHYRLPTLRRGLLRIGPMAAVRSDPLGLWRRQQVLGAPVEVMVLPRIHELRPLPAAPGDEPDTGHHVIRSLAAAHDEFASLREFRPGDDVRRVHWPATARHGRPIVRHHDEPWQRRTTVVVDVRAATHDEPSFERAVSAAASVLQLCATEGELARLVTTGGHDTGFMSTDHEVDSAIDLLAGIAPSGAGSLGGTLRALVHRRSGGALVSCTGRLGDRDRSTLASMGSLFALHLAVVTRPGDGVPRRSRAGSVAATVPFLADTELTGRWAAVVAEVAASGPGGTPSPAPARRPTPGSGR